MATTQGAEIDRLDDGRWARRGAETTAGLFALSLIIFVLSLNDVTVAVSLGSGPDAWFGVAVDRLAALLLVVITGVSGIVQAYAVRYLRLDPSQRSFVVLAVSITLASVLLVSASTLITLAAGWVISGVLVTRLVGLQRASGGAAHDARRVRLTFAIGDGALVVAVLALTIAVGNIDVQDPGALTDAAQQAGGWSIVAAALLAVAALARCAQLPFSAWLPSTLGAPTPTSALLHAGVVNGGGFLLVRLTPVVNEWAPAWYLVAAMGGATALWGAVVMSVSADVKGALVRSTTAQMGFMILTIAAGLPAAAMTHLVAHGMYKAALFLGAGGAVHDATVHGSLPPRPDAPPGGVTSRTLLALVAPAVVLAGSAILFGLHGSELALLAFAWATAATALAGWLRRRSDRRGSIWAMATLIVGSLAYLALIERVAEFLAPSLQPIVGGPGAAGLALLAVGAIAVAVVQARPAMFPRLHARLYVLALSATHTTQRRKVSS